MGETAIRNVPFPESTDAPDVPSDIEAVAQKVDDFGEVPIGAIMIWPFAVAPAHWLLCDGAGISTDYVTLRATGMVNTPNLKGRIPLGVGTLSGDVYALLGTGGESKHHLTIAELPALQFELPGYIHDIGPNPGPYGLANGGGSGPNVQTNSLGGDTPHENRQPFLVVNFIIRAE